MTQSVGSARESLGGVKGWIAVCIFLILPVTAVLHQRVFFPGMCMLNRIGSDYSVDVIARWLTRDPSLPLAVVTAIATYMAGLRWPMIRQAVWPFVVSFMPLAIWIWDVPFTGRAICRAYHDGRLQLDDGHVVSSAWFYVGGAILYLMIVGSLLVRRKRRQQIFQPSAGA
jgi:hypothetical protein